MRLSSKARDLPLRVTTGAYILHSGLESLPIPLISESRWPPPWSRPEG